MGILVFFNSSIDINIPDSILNASDDYKSSEDEDEDIDIYDLSSIDEEELYESDYNKWEELFLKPFNNRK